MANGYDTPNSVGKIIGDKYRTCRVDRHSHRSPACIVRVLQETREKIDRFGRWNAIFERHENHFVPDRLATVPASVHSDKGPVGKFGTHRINRKVDTERCHMCAECVIGRDCRCHFVRILRLYPNVDILSPIAVRPAIVENIGDPRRKRPICLLSFFNSQSRSPFNRRYACRSGSDRLPQNTFGAQHRGLVSDRALMSSRAETIVSVCSIF